MIDMPKFTVERIPSISAIVPASSTPSARAHDHNGE